MEKFTFKEGIRILIDGKRYRLLNQVSVDEQLIWQMVPEGLNTFVGPNRGAIVESAPLSDMFQWYGLGKLTFDDERDTDTSEERERRRRFRASPISLKDPIKQARIGFRRDVIREIEKRLPWGHKVVPQIVDGTPTGRSVLEAALQSIGAALGIKYFGKEANVSVATYYRWKSQLDVANDARDLQGRFNERGNRSQISKVVKSIICTVIHEKIDDAKKRAQGSKPRMSMSDIMDESLQRLDQFRSDNPHLAASIKLPSKSTFYNLLNSNTTAYDRSLAMHGRARTKNDFRRPFGHSDPETCLSEVQFDETLLPIYCFDDVWGIPLGRPYLAWNADVTSSGIIGFYCGFEPPGDLVIASTLRHSILPKAYIKTAYPDICGNFNIGGIPHKITFDNSMQAHGDTIATILNELDTLWDFTGPRMPWLKGTVEGTFDTLNDTLLSEMPGFVLSKEIDACDYDPAKNGCIGFMHFLWILHKWIYEVYHNHSPPGFGSSPNARWQAGTRLVAPTFPRSGTDLDTLVGLVREGRLLDHRGVLYESLRYYSDGIDILRRRKGPSIKVRVRVNPLNLGRIHVYDKDEDLWIPCEAIDRHYAEGLDLHRHLLILRHAERLSGSTNLEALIRARADLQRLIRSSVMEDFGFKSRSAIARATGIGTHSIFNHLNVDGHLAALSSHFPIASVLGVSPNLRALPEQPITSARPHQNLRENMRSAPQFDAPRNAQKKISVTTFASDRSLKRP
jgi:putative transposase